VLLPQLSAVQARDDGVAYSGLLDWGLRMVVLLALPCAIALLVFAQPLVAVLYHYGAFTAADVAQTTRALMGYGVGLMGLVGVKVLAPGFYAHQNMRTPMRIAVAMLVLTQLLNLVFVPRMGHAGLALSIGVAALLNALLLLWGLRRRGMYHASPGWIAFGLRVGVAAALLGCGLAWAAQALDWIALGQQPLVRIGWLALALASAALVYFAALTLMGLSLRQFVRRA